MDRVDGLVRNFIIWIGMTALTWATLDLTQNPTQANEPASKGSSWPQFLGPDRTGISPQTGLLDDWPEGGPKEVWRAPGGVGMSGVAVDRGQLVTLVQREAKQFALALDARNGTPKWTTPVAPEYKNAMGDGPRATPTIHEDVVFVFTGQGVLAALNWIDGNIIWSHDVVRELGGKPAEYGMACSPLVVGDLVVVTAGIPGATVVAYDAKSGELKWKAGQDTAGYSSPALLAIGGKPQIVAYTGGSLIGLSPDTGSVLWRYPYVTDYECNIATPLSVDGKIFISSGENHGCVLLAVSPNGDGFDIREVWSSQGARSVLRNEWQTSILLDGRLYGMDNVGSAGPVTHLTCVDAATGKRLWRQPRFGKGNLIAADGKLFISTMKGELVIVKASPNAFEQIGSMQVVETTRQAPALAGGLLYLRDGREIVCVDVRKHE